MEWIMDYYNFTIIAVCLVVGIVMKNFLPTDNKWIPLAVTIVGVLFGCWLLDGVTPLNVVKGAVSGMASTGLHQLFKQFIDGGNKPSDDEIDKAIL